MSTDENYCTFAYKQKNFKQRFLYFAIYKDEEKLADPYIC